MPGDPDVEGLDPRWQAIIAVGEYVQTEPEAVWRFIRRWGGHPQEDLRDAMADVFGIRPKITCVVREHRDPSGGPATIEIVDEEDAPDEEEALRRVQEMLGAQVTGTFASDGSGGIAIPAADPCPPAPADRN